MRAKLAQARGYPFPDVDTYLIGTEGRVAPKQG